MRALTLAGQWLDEPENRREAAAILARPEYVGVPEEVLLKPLTGHLQRGGRAGRHCRPGRRRLSSQRCQLPLALARGVDHHADDPLGAGARALRHPGARRPRLPSRSLSRSRRRASASKLPESDYKPEGAAADMPGATASFFGEGSFDPRAAMSYLKGLPHPRRRRRPRCLRRTQRVSKFDAGGCRYESADGVCIAQ